MSSKIKVTADSTCDLSRELIEKYQIGIASLSITIGNKSYRDLVDIKPSKIFSVFDKKGLLAKTAAVSVGDYIELFRQYTDQGMAVVHINISSDFSSCYQNALVAAKELGNVYVVDSRKLCSGTGHLVLLAAELAGEGHEPGEIAEILNQTAGKVEASFIIDTLTYLHKGGRCSAVAALGANLLKLKPCIEVKNGKMDVGKKYRGSLGKCLEMYVSDRLKGREDIEPKRIFITHTGCSKELVAAVRAAVEANYPFVEILETIAGCTISSHCGPNTLGILFIRK